ncbi:hypothetical protein [Agromyces sp. NPDC058126]|uniref:hypothetical protein n=1 Tax=Agromyces sp. NPDC058126 TaxID=3346350 RepID=UPI0036DC3925
MNQSVGVGLAALAGLVLFPILLLVLFAAPEQACGGGGRVDLSGLPVVDGFDAEQVRNAALVMNAASDTGLGATAQQVGVMTALGESSLRNLSYGDNAINPDGSVADSIGLFQQQSSWGSIADRMDPSKSAGFFFERLQQVPRWQEMTPTLAAHKVQANADPNHYTRFQPAAVALVNALAGGVTGGGGCFVSGDAKELAQQIMDAHTAGRFSTLSGAGQPDHLFEIQAIADGKTLPGCGVDVGMLQAIVIALNAFDAVQVSDLNRACTGQSLGAGQYSSHNIDGGGHAVDFSALNGTPITGADSDSVSLIRLLDAQLPEGSRVGQSQCRVEAGTQVPLAHLVEFTDSCDHLHVDNAFAKN